MLSNTIYFWIPEIRENWEKSSTVSINKMHKNQLSIPSPCKIQILSNFSLHYLIPNLNQTLFTSYSSFKEIKQVLLQRRDTHRERERKKKNLLKVSLNLQFQWSILLNPPQLLKSKKPSTKNINDSSITKQYNKLFRLEL